MSPSRGYACPLRLIPRQLIAHAKPAGRAERPVRPRRSPAMSRAIIVSGALANKPGNGGGAWERLTWVTGLRRLGFDVYFVEQIAPEACRDAGGAVADLEGDRKSVV